MPIHVCLIANPVGEKFHAVVRRKGRLGYERFIKTTTRATCLSRSDIEAVFIAVGEFVVDAALDGHECDLGPLGSTRLGVRGTFKKAAHSEIENSDIKVTLRLSLAPWIRELLAKNAKFAQVEGVAQFTKAPIILSAEGASEYAPIQLNKWVAGSFMKLKGSNLKFDRTRDDEGVFFRPVGSKESVRATTYGDVFAKTVSVNVPDELKGKTRLKLDVRRRVKPEDNEPLVGLYRDVLNEIT